MIKYLIGYNRDLKYICSNIKKNTKYEKKYEKKRDIKNNISPKYISGDILDMCYESYN